jgi:hypothetical protein
MCLAARSAVLDPEDRGPSMGWRLHYRSSPEEAVEGFGRRWPLHRLGSYPADLFRGGDPGRLRAKICRVEGELCFQGPILRGPGQRRAVQVRVQLSWPEYRC